MAGQKQSKKRPALGTKRGDLMWFSVTLDASPSFVDPVFAFANDDFAGDPAGAMTRWESAVYQHPDANWEQWPTIDRPAEDQALLRTILKGIVSGRHISKQKLEVARCVSVFPIKGSGGYDDTVGGFVVQARPQFRSTVQWFGIGLAALFQGGIIDRVRCCPDRDCGKFFVDWPRPGPHREFCCVQHQDRTFKRSNR